MKSRVLLFALLGLLQCNGAEEHRSLSSVATEEAAPAAEKPADKKENFGWEGAAEESPREKFSDGARSFAKVRDTLLANYYADGLTEDDLYRAATAGMLEKIDPKMKAWNKLLTQREMNELRNDMKGELVGIGIIIRFDAPSGYADVMGALPGSPAEKAGISTGDKIVTVNGKLYKGMSLRDVVYDIRGKVGETLTLTVLHADKLLTLNVVRERVAYDQAERAVLPGNVGYLQIPSFNEKTPGRVREHLNDFTQKAVTALIVDLRKNGGGLFEQAVETASLFLKEGMGVVNVHRKGNVVEKLTAKPGGLLLDVPLVVLVDDGTASGGEFVTAALQEGRHAKVVGKKTHGKWSAQMIDSLANGYAFKYTVSLFKTPSDKSYEAVGLRPDVEIAMDEADFGKAQAAKSPEERLSLDTTLRTALELTTRH